MMERTEDAQSQALRAFLLLCSLGQDWPGRLVLVQGLEVAKDYIPPLLRKDGAPERSGHTFEGRAMSVAASIAGAACLAVESRAEVCRAALRAGACDFVVNSVDEALRILKNEIRKRKPVSVALAMAETAALAELAERGVVADVFLVGQGFQPDAAASTFAAHATEVLGGDIGDMPPEFMVEHYAAENGFQLQEFRFDTAQELQALDSRLRGLLHDGDPRQRWALLAPGFFYRERPFRRLAYVTAAEAGVLGEGYRLA